MTSPVIQVLPGFTTGASRALPPGWLGVNMQLDVVKLVQKLGVKFNP